jgi:hypothetical protein
MGLIHMYKLLDALERRRPTAPAMEVYGRAAAGVCAHTPCAPWHCKLTRRLTPPCQLVSTVFNFFIRPSDPFAGVGISSLIYSA